MNMVLILLGAVLFVVCLGVIERLWSRKEHERMARKWEERRKSFGVGPAEAKESQIR